MKTITELSLDELFTSIGQGDEIPTAYEKLDLEALFAESDRIGNKYQSAEEVETFNKELSELCPELWGA